MSILKKVDSRVWFVISYSTMLASESAVNWRGEMCEVCSQYNRYLGDILLSEWTTLQQAMENESIGMTNILTAGDLISF